MLLTLESQSKQIGRTESSSRTSLLMFVASLNFSSSSRLFEETTWPYDFVSSPFFLTATERGSASGRLHIQDRFVSKALIPAKNAYIGLSIARNECSWQNESKGNQFWLQTDSNGAFTINNVIPGAYGIHGWVPGFIGDYLDKALVTISPGSQMQLGNVLYTPPRDGQTLREICFPDRTTTAFCVPDPNTLYMNKLYINSPEEVETRSNDGLPIGQLRLLTKVCHMA